MITAKIICDSKNEFGNRLTTFVLTFPRIVLAELNTHRMLSRNSASSRAIPFNKMMDNVLQNPFIPIKWMKDHKGMQGTEYFNEEESKEMERLWLQARTEAIDRVQQLSTKGVTKQIINRLLEPFLWHTVICTGTEFENFFALRARPAAEIHIQCLAHKMLDAYNESVPILIPPGAWHIPFGDTLDIDKAYRELVPKDGFASDLDDFWRVKVSTARCARISYNNFEGKDDYQADIKLHDALSASGHWSPFEHCAMSMGRDEYASHYIFDVNAKEKSGILLGWCGNYRGFIQYRKLFAEENKKDGRVKNANKKI